MKTLRILFLLIITFVFIHSGQSQVKFLIGPSGGLTVPAGDYGGTTIEYYNGTKYGLSSGANVGIIAKIKLPNIIRFRFAGNFSFLKNSGNSESDKPNSFVEVKHTVFMLSIGPEFGFGLPASPIKPYAGVDLLLTSFSGETTFRGVSRVPSDGTYSMSSATRIGLGLGAGVEISVGKNSVDVGLRYNFLNLIGKKFEDILPSEDRRLDSYLSLNDDTDPLYNPSDPDKKHPIGSSRSISTFQLNAAFLFGF